MLLNNDNNINIFGVFGFTGSGKSTFLNITDKIPGNLTIPEHNVPRCIPQIYKHIKDEKIKNALINGINIDLIHYTKSNDTLNRYYRLSNALKNAYDIKSFLKHLNNTKWKNIFYESTFMSFSPELFISAFPKSKLIFFIRNPFDAAEKMSRDYSAVFNDKILQKHSSNESLYFKSINGVDIPWWVEEDDIDVFINSSIFVRCICFWKAINLNFFNSIKNHNYLLVRYEDFIKKTPETVELIKNFTDLQLPPKLNSIFSNISKKRINSIGLSRQIDEKDISTAMAILEKSELLRKYINER